jgi:hypothetical protein
MSEMGEDMTLVPAPKSWVDRICEFEGIDYTKIRAKVEAMEGENPDLIKLVEEDSFAHYYIGDYVQMLSDFVDSYPIDYPFTDESDLAVISLKEEISKNLGYCEKSSYNLLYHSSDVGINLEETSTNYLNSWEYTGCTIDDPGCLISESDIELANDCTPEFCYGMATEIFSLKGGVEQELNGRCSAGGDCNPGLDCYSTWDFNDTVCLDSTVIENIHQAERLTDGNPARDATQIHNSGYFYQNIEISHGGNYMLSWYAASDATTIVDYGVKVLYFNNYEEFSSGALGVVVLDTSKTPASSFSAPGALIVERLDEIGADDVDDSGIIQIQIHTS